jgi:hypothetical protein
VIDWDNVEPVPVKLCAVSLEHRITNELETELLGYDVSLVPQQSEMFRQTLLRIEENRTEQDALYQLHMKSRENLVLDRILRAEGWDLSRLTKHYGDLMAKPLERTRNNLEGARTAWDNMVDVWFHQRGRGLPDWPAFVEIQEGLAIYEQTFIHRLKRKMEKARQKQMFRVVSMLSRIFPSWKWAGRKRCYLESRLADVYEWSMSEFCLWAIQ